LSCWCEVFGIGLFGGLGAVVCGRVVVANGWGLDMNIGAHQCCVWVAGLCAGEIAELLDELGSYKCC
jgi:hypothetical protein